MASDNPKVRDFTTTAQNLVVDVQTSPVYELLLSMFAWGTKDDTADYEYAPKCFERLEDGVTGPEAEKLSTLVGSAELWLPLIGIALESGQIGSVARFLEYIDSMDPVELRRSMISGACCHGDVAPDDAEAAAAGLEVRVGVVEGDEVTGVLTRNGQAWRARAVVLTVGTFLGGRILVGDRKSVV